MPKAIFSEINLDKCALCGCLSELQISHIIPSFMIRWFKDSSATGHIRFGENPNVRVQDGPKARMLCQECEQLFSNWEKEFAEKCFEPICDGRAHEIQYTAWMLKATTSISWRVLFAFDAINELSEFPTAVREEVVAALDEWKRFLLNDQQCTDRFGQHMLLVDLLDCATIANVPHNINRYLTRTIDCDVAHNGESAFAYTKMGRFMLFSFVDMDDAHLWEGTKLNSKNGLLGEGDKSLPPELLSYIFNRAKSAANTYSQISEFQQEKILQSYGKNPSRVSASETLCAVNQDVLLFGKRSAFEATQPKSKPHLEQDIKKKRN